METTKKLDTKTMVELGVLIAITIIMGTTPLGTLRTPFLSVSLVTIPVAVGAIIIGPIGGIVCGLTFGLTSLFNALTGASGMMSTLMTVNPVGAIITIIVPRVLEGLLVAYIFIGLKRILKKNKLVYYLASICCPLLNTLLFMSCIVLFFYHSDYIQGLASNLGATNPISFVVLLVGIQGIIEAVACLLIAGTVTLALSSFLKRG